MFVLLTLFLGKGFHVIKPYTTCKAFFRFHSDIMLMLIGLNQFLVNEKKCAIEPHTDISQQVFVKAKTAS